MHGSVLYTSVSHCSAEPGAGGVDCIINKKCLCKRISFCKKSVLKKENIRNGKTMWSCGLPLLENNEESKQASKFLHKSFYILYVY